MKKIYLIMCLIGLTNQVFSQDYNTKRYKKEHVIVNHQNSANITARKLVDCSQTTDLLYCEDFESASAPDLPSNLTTSSLENNYVVPVSGTNENVSGFYVGDFQDARSGGFWQVEEHGQFAMTNDDACMPAGSTPNANNNCNLSFESLQLPTLDFSSQSNVFIQFEYYHDKLYGGGDASVEVSTDGGANWNNVGGLIQESTGVWQLGILNLSTYIDSTEVDIRFIWSDDNSWGTGFAIDDIQVGPLPNYSITLLSPEHYLASIIGNVATKYPIVPLTQVTNTQYNFYGILKNTGVNALDSVRLFADVIGDPFIAQSYGFNIESTDQDSTFCNTFFTPTAIDEYSANLSSSSSGDSITSNIERISFEVSEYIYARDLAEDSDDYSGGVAINDQGTEQRGNTFDIYATADLYGVRVRIHPNTTPGAMAKININSVDVQSGTISFLAESNYKNVGSVTDDWLDIAFETPIPLSQGEVIIATLYAEFDGIDTVFICQNGSSIGRDSYIQDVDGVGPNVNPGDWLVLATTPMLRLNFDPNIEGIADPVGIQEIEKLKIGVHPNPNNGEFQLNLASETSKDFTLSIQNVLGQEVYNETLQSVVSLTKNLNLSHLEKGIYNITLTDKQNNAQTQKIIIR